MQSTEPTYPVTAVFPTRNRIDSALRTLQVLTDCRPAPGEIIVHVDGGSEAMQTAIREKFPAVRILTSTELVGPGGARNKLITSAANDLVANFDDDSFPSQMDYFARVLKTAGLFPDAAIISAASHASEWSSPEFQSIATASGCGCVFRKCWFERTTGFVPLPIAYNMEEADIGLQLHALRGVIVHDPNLRVTHDHLPPKEVNPRSNAVVLANTALLPFLRYPWWLWPAGVWQVLHRIVSLCVRRWTAGLPDGIRMIPSHLITHASYRKVMPGRAVLSWLLLRRWPRVLSFKNNRT